MEKTYQRAMELLFEELQDGTNALEIAAVFSTLSMRIYKTVLTPAEYQQIIDTIAKNSDKVQALGAATERPTLQ